MDALSSIRVLYVGYDQYFIEGFRKSLALSKEAWVIESIMSDQEALILLDKIPIDAVVIDFRAADIDRHELLELINQRYPSVIRLIIAENPQDVDVLIAAPLVHQFINFPCNYDKLMQDIRRLLRLRELLTDSNLRNLIMGIKKLPSLPVQYVRLVKLLQSENATLKEIGDLISQDMVMTAKLLQLVNSAFYSMPGKVTSPHRAVSILGLNTIKALVLVIQVFEEFQDFVSPYFSLKGLWRHSISVGLICKAIAVKTGMDPSIQDDIYIAGILHDIGKLIQVRIPGFHNQVKHERGRVVLESEYAVYHTSHAEIGAYLLNLWGMPEDIVEAVAYHHCPSKLLPEKFGLATIVNLASGFDEIMVDDVNDKPDYSAYLDMAHHKRIGIEDKIPVWFGLANQILSSAIIE